ncbi:Faa-hydrolase family protein [Janthinobacterium sp. Marseille]|nr:fumarylacetoacetate hydrolase family protein [Janthinobacterium sp. Marseille]ABR89561.1 Faa-hydrolase family protein [Janthinobacterium sp. Marseille]
MEYAIDFPPVTTLPVVGSSKPFPVGRIYCVGRNYAEHAREMGHDPDREPPFFFMKPADAIVQNNANIPYPQLTQDLHHEIEMIVAIGKGGADIAVENALEHVFGYGVGLDMTRRDIQGQAKKMGRPWEMGKAFDNSAPCTAITPVTTIGHPNKGAVWLKINGELKQKGDLADLIWNVQETIAYLSQLITLRPGDLIMSGTPAGVGAVQRGDKLVGHVDGLEDLIVSYS